VRIEDYCRLFSLTNKNSKEIIKDKKRFIFIVAKEKINKTAAGR